MFTSAKALVLVSVNKGLKKILHVPLLVSHLKGKRQGGRHALASDTFAKRKIMTMENNANNDFMMRDNFMDFIFDA
jgi:hypothetical protein